MQPPHQSGFQRLHPDAIITLAEERLKRPFSNLLRPYNSYINRVFELEDGDGNGVIVKFYRPGRWEKQALVDEHDFLTELSEHEIPVIPPIAMADGATLGHHQGVYFAFFPKCGGRSPDELMDEQWEEIGRLVGRMHAIGAVRPAGSRMRLAPTASTRHHIDYLKVNDLIPAEFRQRFLCLADELVALASPLFEGVPIQRIHGDLHFANIIHRPGESYFLIDFDDMVMGPQVQDFWMLLPDYGDKSRYELECFLEGYETFHHFNRNGYRLIEPLRAMRYIHYLAWCGRQVVEEGSTPILPDFGTYSFWQTETAELEDQIERIKSQ